MKLWIDDIRLPPEPIDDWEWFKTVNEAIDFLWLCKPFNIIKLISLDHDAGEYAQYGGDYIKILDWLEQENWSIPIHLHTMNPVGRENMRAIIRKNNWKEVL